MSLRSVAASARSAVSKSNSFEVNGGRRAIFSFLFPKSSELRNSERQRKKLEYESHLKAIRALSIEKMKINTDGSFENILGTGEKVLLLLRLNCSKIHIKGGVEEQLEKKRDLERRFKEMTIKMNGFLQNTVESCDKMLLRLNSSEDFINEKVVEEASEIKRELEMTVKEYRGALDRAGLLFEGAFKEYREYLDRPLLQGETKEDDQGISCKKGDQGFDFHGCH